MARVDLHHQETYQLPPVRAMVRPHRRFALI